MSDQKKVEPISSGEDFKSVVKELIQHQCDLLQEAMYKASAVLEVEIRAATTRHQVPEAVLVKILTELADMPTAMPFHDSSFKEAFGVAFERLTQPDIDEVMQEEIAEWKREAEEDDDFQS